MHASAYSTSGLSIWYKACMILHFLPLGDIGTPVPLGHLQVYAGLSESQPKHSQPFYSGIFLFSWGIPMNISTGPLF